MKKVLITGITGFAGSHLAEYLLTTKNYTVSGICSSDRHLANLSAIKDQIKLFTVDLHDGEKTTEIIQDQQPDIIFHLAASAAVGKSFQKPLDVLMNNTASELTILEAVKNTGLQAKIVVVSSAQVYGAVSEKDLPVNETVPFKPDNPYAVSKITQEYLAVQYVLAYKQQIIRVRPFNHVGPRLSADFSLSRFAKAIAEIEAGKMEPVLKVGNLVAKRDFTDVRDMVRAYVLSSEKCVNGEAYNIGTGKSFSIQELLDKLLALSKTKITVEEDPSLLRPSDIPELRCDATKFIETTGWKQEIPIEKTLQDTLDYWRNLHN